jgi:hypothetical protein
MITREYLDKISEGRICLVPLPGKGGITSHEHFGKKLCDCEMLRLIAMARKGLEVEKLVEALEAVRKEAYEYIETSAEYYYGIIADKALEAYRKATG